MRNWRCSPQRLVRRALPHCVRHGSPACCPQRRGASHADPLPYPELFGVADNNGYGLKVYAFLKLAGVPFVHEHVFDASAAPRGQLPYVVDDGETIGDSETIIAHAIAKYRLDHRCGAITEQQRAPIISSRACSTTSIG